MLRTAADSDTNHITRLRVEAGGHMTSSDSLPLLAAAASAASELSSRCSSSLSMDALSTMTAVTSFIDSDPDQDSNSCSNLTSFSGSESNLSNVNKSIGNGNSSPMLNNVQNLIVISSDPSPEVNRKLRPRPRLLHNGYANHMAASSATEQASTNVSAVVVSTGSEASESVSGSDDEDQVTDYLDKLSVEVTSECCGHIGVDSETPRSEAATSNSEVSPRTQSTDSDTPVSPLITTRLAINEQDTISDESGYSEESNPSNKEHDLGGRDDLNDLEEEDFDDTVKGVLISDFSPSERLKYLQRSQSTSSRTNRGHQALSETSTQQPPIHTASTTDFFQNKMPEFCINI